MDPSKKNEYPSHIYPFNTPMNPFPLSTSAIPAPNFSVPPPQIHAPQISPMPSCAVSDDYLALPFRGLSAPPSYRIPPPTHLHHERHIEDRKFKPKSVSGYEPKRSRHNEYQRASSRSEQYSSRNSDRNRGRSRERDRERERGHDRSRYNERSHHARQPVFQKSDSRHSSRSRDKNRNERSSSRRSSYSPSAQSTSERSQRTKSESLQSERDRLLSKWRSNYCETSDDIAKKLEQLVKDEEKDCWIRSSPAELYYKRNALNEVEGTARLDALCNLFDEELIKRGERARAAQPRSDDEPKKRKHRVCRHKCNDFRI